MADDAAGRRDHAVERPVTCGTVVRNERCCTVSAVLWLALSPVGFLWAQSSPDPPRPLPAALTGCDSSRAVPLSTVYRADQVDRPVRPSRLPVQGMPLRLGYVLRGRSGIRFIVESSGKIDRCSIVLLQEESREWTDTIVRQLRSTRYEPARLEGQKVAQWVEQLFIFQNDGRD
jgi:hypothetical protein